METARPSALVVGGSGPGSPRPAEVDALVSRIRGSGAGPALVDSALKPGRGSDRPGPPASRPAETALIKFTSGSTSAPKGVRLAHHSIVRCAHNVGLRLGVEPGDVIFSAMPFFHVGGSVLSVLTAFAHGAAVATVPRFDAEQALSSIAEHACTVQIGMDIMFLKELSSPAFSLDAVRTLRTGWVSAPSRAAAERIYDGMKVRLASVYGMTETSANACMTALTDSDELRLGWHGAPQPGLEVGIFDPESGKRLPDGVPGAIRVKGWALLQGYLGDDARAVDDDGWFPTGDLGVIGDSGYLKFLGRMREMLKVGGENVACAEVEETLSTHPGVAVAYLSATPDHVYGELPVAFVELASGHDLTEEELVAWCRRDLAAYKVPRRVVFLARDEWPLTGPEKVSRAALRALAEKLGTGTASHA
jgi:fatty-acyl-CoA synthase